MSNEIERLKNQFERYLKAQKRSSVPLSLTLDPDQPEHIAALIAEVEAGRAVKEKAIQFLDRIIDHEMPGFATEQQRNAYMIVLEEAKRILLSTPEVCVSQNANNDTQDSLCLADDTQAPESEDKNETD